MKCFKQMAKLIKKLLRFQLFLYSKILHKYRVSVAFLLLIIINFYWQYFDSLLPGGNPTGPTPAGN